MLSLAQYTGPDETLGWIIVFILIFGLFLIFGICFLRWLFRIHEIADNLINISQHTSDIKVLLNSIDEKMSKEKIVDEPEKQKKTKSG